MGCVWACRQLDLVPTLPYLTRSRSPVGCGVEVCVWGGLGWGVVVWCGVVWGGWWWWGGVGRARSSHALDKAHCPKDLLPGGGLPCGGRCSLAVRWPPSLRNSSCTFGTGCCSQRCMTCFGTTSHQIRSGDGRADCWAATLRSRVRPREIPATTTRAVSLLAPELSSSTAGPILCQWGRCFWSPTSSAPRATAVSPCASPTSRW